MLDRDIKGLFAEIVAIAPAVHVVGAEDALTKPHYNQCTRVTLREGTDPKIIASLPAIFAREPVEYKIEGVDEAPTCGQVNHVCSCETGPA